MSSSTFMGPKPPARPDLLKVLAEVDKRGLKATRPDISGSVSASTEVTDWVAVWARASPALVQVKRGELRRLKTGAALAQLEDHFRYALRTARPTKTSGLVAQQKIFKKLRHG